AQIGRHVLARLRQALDVRLIDDGLFPGDAGPDFAASPIEGLVDHDGLRHAARVVATVEAKVLARTAGAIGKTRVAPDQPSRQPLGIAIEHELVAVEAMAMLRLIGAVHAIAVELSGRDVVEVAVPNVLAALGQLDAFELA